MLLGKPLLQLQMESALTVFSLSCFNSFQDEWNLHSHRVFLIFLDYMGTLSLVTNNVMSDIVLLFASLDSLITEELVHSYPYVDILLSFLIKNFVAKTYIRQCKLP